MQLREYQRAAVKSVYDYLRQHEDNPVVVIPTAGGKTPVIATICHDAVCLWQGRVLILAHVKELLAQAADKLRQVCPDVAFGVYSAGLNSRDTAGDVIVAGIQSVYQRAAELGPFDLVMIDECHLVPKDGEGMYRRFLDDARAVNPNLRVVGFTATPFRLDSGPICTPEGPLHAICYEVGVKELLRDGFLTRPVARAGKHKPDTTGLSVQGGEFLAREAELLMNTESLVASACREIVENTEDRQACLIFAAGVDHAQAIAQAMRVGLGVECDLVTAETNANDRQRILDDFCEGRLKYLVNVGVLTTGFDAPNIDCVALLRPTMSPGLYYQMLGRGFRLHPDKQDCLILDFAGNVLRHGPVDCVCGSKPQRDGLSPAKECPECQALLATRYANCPQCGFEFPPTDPTYAAPHDEHASSASVLSGEVTVTQYEVRDVFYSVHRKRDAADDAPRSMCVEYRLGLNHFHREFICVEHSGYAKARAMDWWRARSSDPMPETAEQAVKLAECGALAHTESITLRATAGERYDQLIDYRIGEKPEAAIEVFDDAEVPF